MINKSTVNYMDTSKGQNIAVFLEGLRKSKNISRADFCNDIMSQRHYQRYLKGELDISNVNLAKFADKLEIHILHLQRAFENATNDEVQYLNGVSLLLNSFEYNKAYIELQKHKNKTFSSKFYNNLYKLLEVKANTSLKKITYEDSVSTLKKLADYNNLATNKSFTYVELASASYLAKLEAQKKETKTIDILYKIVTDQENITFFGRHEVEWMVTIYSTMSTVYGLLDQFDKVIILSDIGIQICHEKQLLVSLPHQYYNKALALKLTNNLDKGLKFASLALMSVRLEQSETKFASFKAAIEKNFIDSIENLKCWT